MINKKNKRELLHWRYGEYSAGLCCLLTRFMKVYSDIPINIRKEIIVLMDDEPISWNVACIEIRKETKPGEKILNKLISLGFI